MQIIKTDLRKNRLPKYTVFFLIDCHLQTFYNKIVGQDGFTGDSFQGNMEEMTPTLN